MSKVITEEWACERYQPSSNISLRLAIKMKSIQLKINTLVFNHSVTTEG